MSVIDRSKSIYSWMSKLRQIGRIQIGRLTGTVGPDHGGYKTWASLLERSYFLRAELNAMTALLVTKGVFTEAEWQKQVDIEAELLFTALAKDWPEIEFHENGFTIKDAKALAERSRRERWPP